MRAVEDLKIGEIDIWLALDRGYILRIECKIIVLASCIHDALAVFIYISPDTVGKPQGRQVVTAVGAVSRFIFMQMAVANHPDIPGPISLEPFVEIVVF